MATEVLPDSSALDLSTAGRLLLIWQEPVTRRFCRVGELHHLADGRYVFRYSEGAHLDGFLPLAEFPNLDSVYVSTSLPAFFANRVMSRKRESYPEYRRWIGLEGHDADTPFEVLARTGGPRETDTFHVVDDLCRTPAGLIVSRFFVSGVRYLDGAADRLQHLAAGSPLYLRPEPDNPVNRRALLVDAAGDKPIGYVPDWLVEDVHELRRLRGVVRVFAERVNVDAPMHLRLLCRIEAE